MLATVTPICQYVVVWCRTIRRFAEPDHQPYGTTNGYFAAQTGPATQKPFASLK